MTLQAILNNFESRVLLSLTHACSAAFEAWVPERQKLQTLQVFCTPQGLLPFPDFYESGISEATGEHSSTHWPNTYLRKLFVSAGEKVFEAT